MVGALVGAALVVGLIVLLFWWKKRRDSEDEEQFFDMTNPNEKKFDGITPNPFLTAAGGAGGAGAAGAGGRMALGTAAHAHQGSNTTHSYSSNNEDVLHYDDNHHHRGDVAGQDEYFSSGAGEDYGRRRLLNGSLPDMIMRKPGSLQVVNN